MKRVRGLALSRDCTACVGEFCEGDDGGEGWARGVFFELVWWWWEVLDIQYELCNFSIDLRDV